MSQTALLYFGKVHWAFLKPIYEYFVQRKFFCRFVHDLTPNRPQAYGVLRLEKDVIEPPPSKLARLAEISQTVSAAITNINGVLGQRNPPPNDRAVERSYLLTTELNRIASRRCAVFFIPLKPLLLPKRHPGRLLVFSGVLHVCFRFSELNKNSVPSFFPDAGYKRAWKFCPQWFTLLPFLTC